MATSAAVIKNIIETSVNSLGYELVGCVYIKQQRRSLLRIFIDKPEGITLDDCERVSRQVSAVLDVEDPIIGAYSLEVSSPGLDRPLFTAEHFRRFIGARAHIKLDIPFTDNRRNFTGYLQGITESDKVIITVDNEEVVLPLANIAKAHLLPDIPTKARGKKT